MREKPDKCKQCPWFQTTFGYIPPFGTCDNGIAIVSDYPELEEIDTNIPLSYGRAGDMFNRTLHRLKETRSRYGIRYLTHCYHPRKKSGPSRENLDVFDGWEGAADYCTRIHGTTPSMFSHRAKATMCLGPLALSQYVGVPASDRTRGYIYKGDRYITPTMGTYHPALVGAGNTGLLFTLRYDFANILGKASENWGGSPKHFKIDPTPEAFHEFVSEVIAKSSWCVVDIETPFAGDDESEYSKKKPSFDIERASFCASFDTDLSVSVQWLPYYFDDIKRLMESGLDIVYWNGDYDDPRLDYNGFTRSGRFIDAMWLWHFLQPDLPKALAHTATYFTDLPEWKSMSRTDPGYYSCCDAYAEAKCYERILSDLGKKDMLPIAERHVTELLGILRKARKRGIQTNPTAIAEMRATLERRLDEFDATIKGLYPDSIKRTKQYKKPPSNITKGTDTHGSAGKIGGKEGIYLVDYDGNWSFRFEFNPSSASQLKDYLRSKGVRIPKSWKTKRETTDAKALNRILAQTGDELVEKLITRAKIQKIFSTYTSWPIDEQGKVHPTMNLTPATQRLACEHPNFQNNPKEGELAAMVRNCIIASPNCKLVASDYVGMESFLTGYFAQDEEYITLSTMNIYAFAVAKYKCWELSKDEAELRKLLKKYKARAKAELEPGESKTLYDKFKIIILAIGYGAGRDTIFYQNPGLFKDLSEAGSLREFILKETFPKIAKWQQDVVQLAKGGYLFNPWHYVRYFLDCPGSDSSKAMAQLPQSTGAAMIKECILQIDKTWLGEYFVLQIHDEIIYDVPDTLVSEAKILLRNVMEQAWKELGGRSIKVSVKVGTTMQDLEEEED